MNKSSLLVFGDTGDGKTGLMASWIRYIVKLTGKPVHYYTHEPGGTSTLQHLIQRGEVVICDLSAMSYASESIDRAANGWWPSPDGKLAKPDGFSEVGGIIHEGGTSYGEAILEELCIAGAQNKIMGAETAPQQFTSGETRIAGANQTYYGIAQRRLRKAIIDSHRLPVHLAWTCRERKVDDEEKVSGFRQIYGPLLAGGALTPHAPAWFGRTIHVDALQELDPKTKQNRTVRKAFFKTHFYEGDKTPYIANPRLPVSVVDLLPDAIEIAKDESTMEWFFTKVEELLEKARAS